MSTEVKKKAGRPKTLNITYDQVLALKLDPRNKWPDVAEALGASRSHVLRVWEEGGGWSAPKAVAALGKR